MIKEKQKDVNYGNLKKSIRGHDWILYHSLENTDEQTNYLTETICIMIENNSKETKLRKVDHKRENWIIEGLVIQLTVKTPYIVSIR